MFGITFEGNRDLRRIYMPPDYQSFPLRKDFYLRRRRRPLARRRRPADGADPHAHATPRPRRSCAGRRTEPRASTPTMPVTAQRHASADDPARPARPRARASSSRSRRTRRGPSARPSSTRSATARCSSTWGRSTPSTHGVLRVVLKLDGEKVVDLDPVLGYLHRGVEKLCENADYHQAICYLDPLEYVSSLFCEWRRRHGLREAARRPGPAPRRVHPGPLGRAQPDRQPRPVPGLDGARPRRPDADPVVVHRARRDRRHAGVADRPADALQLLPDRRRQRRPQPRVHEPPRRLDEPRDRADRGRQRAPQRERDLRPPDARPRHDRHRDGAADGA